MENAPKIFIVGTAPLKASLDATPRRARETHVSDARLDFHLNPNVKRRWLRPGHNQTRRRSGDLCFSMCSYAGHTYECNGPLAHCAFTHLASCARVWRKSLP